MGAVKGTGLDIFRFNDAVLRLSASIASAREFGLKGLPITADKRVLRNSCPTDWPNRVVVTFGAELKE